MGLGYYVFVETPAEKVAISKRFKAMTTKQYCEEILALPRVTLIWCDVYPEDLRPRRITGKYYTSKKKYLGLAVGGDNVILIDATAPLDQIADIVAHELRHVYQVKNKHLFPAGMEEDDACNFAGNVIEALKNDNGG